MNAEAQRLKDDNLAGPQYPSEFALKYNWVARELDLTSRSITREVRFLLCAVSFLNFALTALLHFCAYQLRRLKRALEPMPSNLNCNEQAMAEVRSGRKAMPLSIIHTCFFPRCPLHSPWQCIAIKRHPTA